FVPLGAIMPALAPDHKGAAMAMYTTAAGGATFLGSFVAAVVRPWGGNVGVVWAFVVLYALAFLMTFALKVEQPRLGVQDDAEADATASAPRPPSSPRSTDPLKEPDMAQSISPLFDLTGRTALVTGGAKGLGLAMARGLAEHGAPIVLADIDDETGRAAAEELAAATGVSVSYRHLDVTDQAMVERVVAEI